MNKFIGEISALLAAFLWAFAASIMEKLTHKVSPKELNLFKGIVALILFTFTSIIIIGESIQNFHWQDLSILFLSGVIGIGIGDIAYFNSLKKIGSRQAILLFALSPPIAALIGWVFLGEILTLSAWIGILITTVGVAWVVTESTSAKKEKIEKRNLISGILFGVIAAIGQAVGLVLSRFVMVGDEISALQGAAVRLSAGILFTLGWIILSREQIGKWNRSGDRKSIWRMIIISAIIGTYLCLWLQQFAIENAPVGIVQTLLSTCPIFILPIAAIKGEKITWRAVLGAFVSIFGVMLVFGIVG